MTSTLPTTTKEGAQRVIIYNGVMGVPDHLLSASVAHLRAACERDGLSRQSRSPVGRHDARRRLGTGRHRSGRPASASVAEARREATAADAARARSCWTAAG